MLGRIPQLSNSLQMFLLCLFPLDENPLYGRNLGHFFFSAVLLHTVLSKFPAPVLSRLPIRGWLLLVPTCSFLSSENVLSTPFRGKECHG